jgi:hypothetical protein
MHTGQDLLMIIRKVQATIASHQNQEVRRVVPREIKPCLHQDILDREVEALIQLIMMV